MKGTFLKLLVLVGLLSGVMVRAAEPIEVKLTVNGSPVPG